MLEQEPVVATRRLALLAELLHPKFNNTDESKFQDDWARWERSILDYEEFDQKPFDKNLKIAIVLERAPEEVKRYSQINAMNFQDDYEKFKSVLAGYFRTRRSWTSSIGSTSCAKEPQPMEVDEIRAKGTGKERQAWWDHSWQGNSAGQREWRWTSTSRWERHGLLCFRR